MEVRNKLAQLYAHLDDSFEKYTMEPAAQWLLGMPDHLKILAQFNLPEITMLICARLNEHSPEWMKRFFAVAPLYANTTSESLEKALAEHGINELCTAILPLLDTSRLQRIVGFRAVYSEKIQGLQHEVKDLQQKVDAENRIIENDVLLINELKSKAVSGRSQDDTKQIKNAQSRINKRTKKINLLSSQLEDKKQVTSQLEEAIKATEQASIVLQQVDAEYENKLIAVCTSLSEPIGGVSPEVVELDEEKELPVLAARLIKMEGKARAGIMEAIEERLFGDNFGERNVSDFFGVLLDQTTDESSIVEDYALHLIERLEDIVLEVTRKAERAEKKLAQISENVYSACYQSIEELETLVSNLRFFETAIPPQMICKQLSKPLSELRNGLSSMGVGTVVPTELWENGSLVPFDLSVHEAEAPVTEQEVILRTMGFVYKDKWDEECIHPAKVINKVKSTEKPKSSTSPINVKSQITNGQLASKQKKRKKTISHENKLTQDRLIQGTRINRVLSKRAADKMLAKTQSDRKSGKKTRDKGNGTNNSKRGSAKRCR